MQQVLWNILSNSLKFTPSGGRLDVRTRHLDSQVEISVTDTGVGLEPAFLPFVFDRFRQADQTFTRTFGGLGLGLAIVKHLVELHPPALIIADIGMPGEDGLSMMGRLRRLPPEHGGTLPAIALSAYARAEDKAAALGAGFSDFLTKPATPEDVIRAVQHLLS